MKIKKQRPGRKFEKAVYAFAKTLDASAEVLFDHKVKDRDTGEPRQCDVWINAKFGGHWPQSILVSCKDQTRKLHSGDVGTFCDEIRSTNATLGVLYSKSGFTKPAIQKAVANGIACCRLYDNEPADLPSPIWIVHFLCKPTIQLEVTDVDLRLHTWHDLFRTTIRENNKTVLEIIASVFSQGEANAISVMNEQIKAGVASLPDDWGSELRFEIVGLQRECILRVFGRWKTYRAKFEAILLNGSYSLSNPSFKGTITGPSIDTWGEHLEAWQEIPREDVQISSNCVFAILHGSDIRAVLPERLGSSPLRRDPGAGSGGRVTRAKAASPLNR
ncbi:MAG: restriction endonuclease [Pyrinomonadaceae bacterium]